MMISDAQVLFYSKMILTELRTFLKENPKKWSYSFAESLTYLIIPHEEEYENQNFSFKDVSMWKWKSSLEKIIHRDYDNLSQFVDEKSKGIALLKWSLKILTEEYIEKMVNRSMKMFVKSFIDANPESNAYKKLIIIFNKINHRLEIETYKGFNKKNYNSFIGGLVTLPVTELLPLQEPTFTILNNSKNYHNDRKLLNSSITNPKEVLEIIEELEDCYVYNGIKYTESRLFLPTFLISNNQDPVELEIKWIQSKIEPIIEDSEHHHSSIISKNFLEECCFCCL